MKLPEVATIGIYNSAIAAKNHSFSKSRNTSMFEIELPVENSGISYIDSSSGKISTNMIICAKPGQTRHTKFPFKCYYVHMIIHDGPLYDILIKCPDYLEIKNTDVYKNIFEKLIKHYNNFSDSEEIIIQSLLLELIYTLGKDSSLKLKNTASTGKHMLIENSLNYIKENLTDNLSLEKLSRAMNVSPIHFHNSFKVAVGKTLRVYIEEQRIKKSINLLVTTKSSLTEIAYECGFTSQSYFSYVFKRKMKITPGEYAKRFFEKYEQ